MITLPLSPYLDPTIKRAWLVDEEAGIRTPLLTGTDMLILQAEIKRLSFIFHLIGLKRRLPPNE